MIEFIEKEPIRDNSLFTGGCDLYPNYMVKDGKEFFMFNRRETDNKWAYRENEERKKQLLNNGGTFFRFHGFYENPLIMIKEIAARKEHFVEPEDLFWGDMNKEGYEDFHGNLAEVSAAFLYRIYDFETLEKIKKAVEFLNQEQWDNTISIIKGKEK